MLMCKRMGVTQRTKLKGQMVEASFARYRQFYSKLFLGEMNEPEQEIHGTKVARVLPVVST